MNNIGILAYGSVIDYPGPEIKKATVRCIKDVETPFKVEFARKSKERSGAPTLTIVEEGGASVKKALIFVMGEYVSKKDAIDMLYRRERNKVGSGKEYPNPPKGDVRIKCLDNFHDLDVVLYAQIKQNIPGPTAIELAELALNSLSTETIKQKRDGVSYLIDVKRNGIETPLMADYEKEILRQGRATSLEEIVSRFEGH